MLSADSGSQDYDVGRSFLVVGRDYGDHEVQGFGCKVRGGTEGVGPL